MQTYIRLLRQNSDYSRLWFAQVISLLGDWFNTIALSTLVVAYAPENKGLAVSALLVARVVPPMLISPVAGVLIDRFDRKRLLVWSNYLRAVVVVGFLLTTSNPSLLWVIYALTIVQFLLSAVFEPGQSAIIPNLVPRDDLVQANTLVSITWSVMLALGAAIGGVVSAAFGTNVALVIDVLTFAFAGWLISPIKAHKFVVTAPEEADIEAVRGHGDRSFGEGLRYLRRHPGVAATLLIKFGSSLGNSDTVMTIFATQVFILGEGGKLSLGIMYSVFGIGAILGPVLLNRFNDGSVRVMRRLITLGFVFIVAAWLVMAGASSLLILCIALLLRAMGGSANWTYSSVMIQKLVPDAYLGRMFSIDMALFYLATLVSTVTFGALVDTLGTEKIYDVFVLMIGASSVPLLLWVLATRRWQRRESPVLAEN